MEKLKMETIDNINENIRKIGELFPNCVTEGENGQVIDFDILRQELSKDVVEGYDERYQFTWPDKRKAILTANMPINKTLRPNREESVNFDETENLYIEGDNLDVLKCLQETYMNKVKMIYIDPPYNTGKDFVYKDKQVISKEEYDEISGDYDEESNRLVQNLESNGRFHTDWLNMMYPRLKVARDLLAEDGVIFISIDDKEVENMKKMCNEIFGEKNFIGQWHWYKSATPPNLSKKIKKNLEYILCYEKQKTSVKYRGVQKISPSNDPITKPQNTMKELHFGINTLNCKVEDCVIEAGTYGTKKYPSILLDSLEIKNGMNKNEVRFSNRFIWVQSKLDEEIMKGTQFYLSKDLVISFKKSKYDQEVPPNLIDDSVGVGTTEIAGKELGIILKNEDIFEYPKPVSLLEYILQFNCNKNLIILDFFSGSATTAHAVMKLNAEDGGNRKFIMVQLPEETNEKSEAYKAGYKNICEIGKERIRRAGKKILEDNEKEKEPKDLSNLDTGFRVLKLDSSNIKNVYYHPNDYRQESLFDLENNIKEDRTAEDLLFQVMLDMGVVLSSDIEVKEIENKKIFSVNHGDLICCFDNDITESVVESIAKLTPHYAIFCDSSLSSDATSINFEQIFKAFSPETERRIV